MAAFWTSFLDGLTGEGIFGDLDLPDVPTRFFLPQQSVDLEPIMAAMRVLDKKTTAAEREEVRAMVHKIITEIIQETAERHGVR